MYAPVSHIAGNQPFNDWFVPDTVQRHPLGLKLAAIDPYWGWGEFIYLNSGGAIGNRSLCVFNDSFVAAGVPNAANQGFPLAVCMYSISASGQFGWYMTDGMSPIAATATVAADAALGITGVGTVGANTAGKQILGVRNRISQTGTKAFNNVQTLNNNGLLTTNGYDGLFLGAALSGTNIPASALVSKLFPDGRTIQMGSVIGTFDKLATGTGSITLTGTWTGYTIAMIQSPFAQGAIT